MLFSLKVACQQAPFVGSCENLQVESATAEVPKYQNRFRTKSTFEQPINNVYMPSCLSGKDIWREVLKVCCLLQVPTLRSTSSENRFTQHSASIIDGVSLLNHTPRPAPF